MNKEDIDYINNRKNWLYLRGSSKQDAEDIIQDTFIRVLKNYHKIKDEPIGKKRHYINLVVRSVWYDRFRKTKRSTPIVYIGNFDIVEIEDVVYNEDKYSQIESVIPSLPVNQIKVLKERLEGKKFEDIAGEMGCSVNTVLGRFRSARIAIQKKLAEIGSL